MASPREYAQSIVSVMALVQSVDDDLLATPGVAEILKDMDNLADELREVLE